MVIKISKLFTYFIKNNGLLLLVVLVVGIIIRYIYFNAIGHSIIMVSDSWTYLNCAKMMQKTFYIDVYRPPVYPSAILLFGTLLSWEKYYLGVIILQILLSIISTVLIFKIGMIVSGSKPASILTAVIINVSLGAYGWDFTLMTENFSTFFVTLLTYLILKYFQDTRLKHLTGILIVLSLAIFTKPFFLFLPLLVIMLFLFNKALNKIKLNLTYLITGCAIIYLSIFAYCALNYKINGYFGLTSVSNVNCFGKILQYKMESLGRNIDLIEDIKHAYNTTDKYNLVNGEYLEPWGFLSRYGWDCENYKALGEFSYTIIKTNIPLFINKSLELTTNIILKTCPFRDYIAVKAIDTSKPISNSVIYLKSITDFIDRLYIFIILFFLQSLLFLFYLSAIRLKGNKKIIKQLTTVVNKSFPDTNCYGLFTIFIIILYHYFVSSFFSYGDYSRLLTPAYYLIYLSIILSIFTIYYILIYILHKFNLIKIFTTINILAMKYFR